VFENLFEIELSDNEEEETDVEESEEEDASE
jgi:hypothetical protein